MLNITVDQFIIDAVVSVGLSPFINGIKYFYSQLFEKELSKKVLIVLSIILPAISGLLIAAFYDQLSFSNWKEILTSIATVWLISQMVYKSYVK